MNITWRTIIWQQFGAAIDMLDMRHVQEHASQLSLLLGHKGVSVPDWAARADHKDS
jgi:hypothetical protein